MHRKAVLWITEVFHISLTWEVEVLASLISIHLYLNKLSGHYYLRVISFSNQHIVKSLLDCQCSHNIKLY